MEDNVERNCGQRRDGRCQERRGLATGSLMEGHMLAVIVGMDGKNRFNSHATSPN